MNRASARNQLINFVETFQDDVVSLHRYLPGLPHAQGLHFLQRTLRLSGHRNILQRYRGGNSFNFLQNILSFQASCESCPKFRNIKSVLTRIS